MTPATASFTAQRRRLLVGAGAALAAPGLLAQERWPARPVEMD